MSGPHDVEMDYNTKLSQRKDSIEEFEDAIEEFDRCLLTPERRRDVSNKTVMRERERAIRNLDVFP